MTVPSVSAVPVAPPGAPTHLREALADGRPRTDQEISQLNSDLAKKRITQTIQDALDNGYDKQAEEVFGEAAKDYRRYSYRKAQVFDETLLYMLARNTDHRPRFLYGSSYDPLSLAGESASAFLGWFPSMPALLLPDLIPVSTQARMESGYSSSPNNNVFGLLPENAISVDNGLLGHVTGNTQLLHKYTVDGYTVKAPPRGDRGIYHQTHVRLALAMQALEDLIEIYEIPAKKSLALLRKIRNDTWLLRIAYFYAIHDEMVKTPLHYRRISKRQKAFMEHWKDVLRPAYVRLKTIRDLLEAPTLRLQEGSAAGPHLAARIYDVGNPFEPSERKQLAALLKQHVMWSLFAPARLEEVVVHAGGPALSDLNEELSFEDFTEISNRTLLEFQQQQGRG